MMLATIDDTTPIQNACETACNEAFIACVATGISGNVAGDIALGLSCKYIGQSPTLLSDDSQQQECTMLI